MRGSDAGKRTLPGAFYSSCSSGTIHFTFNTPRLSKHIKIKPSIKTVVKKKMRSCQRVRGREQGEGMLDFMDAPIRNIWVQQAVCLTLTESLFIRGEGGIRK